MKRQKCALCKKNVRHHHKYCDKHWLMVDKLKGKNDYEV